MIKLQIGKMIKNPLIMHLRTALLNVVPSYIPPFSETEKQNVDYQLVATDKRSEETNLLIYPRKLSYDEFPTDKPTNLYFKTKSK
jgi:hypothetical protein